ncbi:TolB protein [Candidatus Kinetoplastibacterium blastocrithidii TCC012E]|uniref:TolB protein n=1 Tax=Candidatus Kinetoplastidibacterium blastocrithidiae TCC012E TaxID=1208922 RepID=M1LC31_9PROT|nr:PD40 domain-containing protein [Candidatus Kinetoplastibacterium blastocrithidii]AFZ83195.1 TolB protein [Candidatus Kinetoplastibacterium blastocrithidii (ex Strigomonas culicis)]AGF50008.1 TolB protein [Candidatus Kinetoplastibacterium blastocrithidii TCC012E]
MTDSESKLYELIECIDNFLLLSFLIICLLYTPYVYAKQNNLDNGKYTVAIYDFKGVPEAGLFIKDTISKDLNRINKFKIKHDFKKNKKKTANDSISYIIKGEINQESKDVYNVNYQLVDFINKITIDNVSFSGSKAEISNIAHLISDRIFRKITGEKGIFSTKIASVLYKMGIFELVISDYNYKNHQVALRSKEPIISLSWSPEGSRIAYSSFETGKPVIYIHNIATGERKVISDDYSGASSSPAWSPDGLKIAATMTKNRLPQIYIVDLNSKNIDPFISSYSSDTEPVFTKDGKHIIFNSDRSGTYQIYKSDINASKTNRITFNGEYNSSPKISSDSSKLLYIKKKDNKFQIACLNMLSNTETILTNGDNDCSPCFSPNNNEIIYISNKNDCRTIETISLIDGSNNKIYNDADSSIIEISWGPFIE